MSLNHKDDCLHNKMSGEALCSAMLSTTALLAGNVNGDLHLVLLCLVTLGHICPHGSCRSGMPLSSALSAKLLSEAEVPFKLG